MTPFGGVSFGRRMLSLRLYRIHADHASSPQVPGFRVGTVLTVAGPPFALTEKLDKDVQHEYKTVAHENQENPHRRLTLSVPNLPQSRLHRSFCQGISERGKSGMRGLKKSQ